MTHFAGIVLYPTTDIDALLEPYNEDGEWFKEGSRWDWWVVGGRFTGLLDNYDPTTDPVNLETCNFCDNGITTQRVADIYPAYQESVGKTCIQCKGTSTVVKFILAPHNGDIIQAKDVSIESLRWIPSVIVTPDGIWHEQAQHGWWGTTLGEKKEEDRWKKEFTDLLNTNREGNFAILVDFHV